MSIESKSNFSRGADALKKGVLLFANRAGEVISSAKKEIKPRKSDPLDVRIKELRIAICDERERLGEKLGVEEIVKLMQIYGPDALGTVIEEDLRVKRGEIELKSFYLFTQALKNSKQTKPIEAVNKIVDNLKQSAINDGWNQEKVLFRPTNKTIERL